MSEKLPKELRDIESCLLLAVLLVHKPKNAGRCSAKSHTYNIYYFIVLVFCCFCDTEMV